MFDNIMQHITWLWQQPQLINLNYALPGLLFIVIISIVILPIPIETLMLTSLTLAKHWHYSLPTLICVFLIGTYVGLHVGYGIGYWLAHLLEPWLLKKLRLSPLQWQIKLVQFKRFRLLILLFGLFIPGFRHVIGILAGASRMRYRTFALSAFMSTTLWVGSFTIAGWLLGR